MTAIEKKLAVVGFGGMGKRHSRVVRQLAGCRLVGVVDPVQKEDGDIRVFPSLSALVESEELDAVIVATPPESHEPVAVALARLGIPTLIEKPLAHSLESAKRIRDNFHMENVVGISGHVERFNPAVTVMREAIVAGEIGEILQVSTVRHGRFPEHLPGIGCVMDLGTHDIDLVRFLTDQEYESADTWLDVENPGEVEGLAISSGQLSHGALFHHSVNWRSFVKYRSITVFGTHGQLSANLVTPRLSWAGEPKNLPQRTNRGGSPVFWPREHTLRIPRSEPLHAQLKSFLRALDQVPTQSASLDDGLEAVRVAEGMRMGHFGHQADQKHPGG